MGRVEDLAKQLSSERLLPPPDAETQGAAPFLWEMLTLATWKDGTERIPSSIKIERVSGAYRVSLQDDALCIKKTFYLGQLRDLVGQCEAALVNEEVPWESFRSFKNKAGPKVKKVKRG